MRRSQLIVGVVSSMLAVLTAAPAPAQTVAEFYRGKSIELGIGVSVGGGYDLYARLLARHMSRFIPGNPIIVAKNIEGAGSLRLANRLYNVAPQDGTTFGTIGRGTAFDPLLGTTGAQFEGTKFIWIGSANNEVSVCVIACVMSISARDGVGSPIPC
jgi:tripartite-type tricarboxylate transporter receptor subunit TctC